MIRQYAGSWHQVIVQTKDRETASAKEQFKQKVGSLRAMHTMGRMLMHKKKSKQKVESLRAVQIRGRMLMHNKSSMQTIQPSQVLF